MATVAYSSRSNEQATIRSAQLGKADALGVLYTKYRSFVHHRCLALTRDVTLAEDLTQEVFLQMCRSISTFKGNADFRTWLYRIATNAFLMHLRKNKHRLLSLEQPVSDESEEVTLGETLPSVSLHPDDYLLLSEAVSGLSSSGREILLMHDLGGYKHNEIARILGMRDGTSKSQLYCARDEGACNLFEETAPATLFAEVSSNLNLPWCVRPDR